MKFMIVYPATRRTEIVNVDDMRETYRQAGLGDNIDHGVVYVRPDRTKLCIVVNGFGLFTPVDMQTYFSINDRLYAGNAVLYAANETGETIDNNMQPDIIWYKNVDEIEREIKIGRLERPVIRFNGKIVWEWPSPNPWIK